MQSYPVPEDRLFLLGWLKPLRGKLSLEASACLSGAREALANWQELKKIIYPLARAETPPELEQPVERLLYEVQADMLSRWGLALFNTIPPVDSYQDLKSWCELLQMSLTVPDQRWEAELEGSPVAALEIAFPLLMEAIHAVNGDRVGELPATWDKTGWHNALASVRWWRLKEPQFFVCERDFLSLTKAIWNCMRQLGGRHRPPEPCSVPDARAARHVLDIVAWWCAENVRPEQGGGVDTPCSAMGTDQQEADKPGTRCRFRKSGNIWDLEYEGESGQYRDLVGLNYIARLLGQVHKPVNALDLYGSQDRVKADRHSPQPVADKEALAAYHTKLRDLDDGIVKAKEEGDSVSLSIYQKEKAQLLAEVRRAIRGHGRLRDLGPAASDNKAADAVRKSIDNALRRIGQDMPRLSRYLKLSIQWTNAVFAYHPPTPAPAWEL
jgi:hypothetical protein